MKFQIEADAEYISGYLRYGHYTTIVEANSREELKEMLEDEETCEKIMDTMQIVVDSIAIDEIGPVERPFVITLLEE